MVQHIIGGELPMNQAHSGSEGVTVKGGTWVAERILCAAE